MKHLLCSLSLIIGVTAHAQLPPYTVDGFGPGVPGYHFISTTDFGGNSYPARLMIIDGGGHIVYHRVVPGASNFRVWPDGRMSYAAGGRNLLMDSTFAVIDTVVCANGVNTDLHDIRLLPNGHYLLLGSETFTMDLSGYNVFQPNNGPGSATAQVRADLIQELDAMHDLVWEWHVKDHFDFLETDVLRLTNPNNVDWSHCNAVELDSDGNILLSARHFNEVIKIDRNADTVIWHLGGVSNDFTFINDAGFLGQHDIRRLPNGNVTLFDNGRAGVHPCRGVEYELDEVALTATPVWSRDHGTGAWSRAMGSTQRLGDGNTLIGWGVLSPDNAVFSVYAPDSSLVRELRFTDTLQTYRAFHFEDLPFVLNRPEITCTAMGGMYQLTAEAGWASYSWSTGASGQSIMAGPNDTVHVEVPAGPSGGWLRSEPFVPVDNCLTTSVAEWDTGDPLLYPNPAENVVHVRLPSSRGPVQLELMDALGRIHWSQWTTSNVVEIPLEGISPGMYMVRIDGAVHRFVKA